MLVLPTGQVMYDDGRGGVNGIEIYTDPGLPQDSWRPTIASVPSRLVSSQSYTVSGTQLAGLSNGAAYGDDNQSASNYPLVRITNITTGTVTFAPTTNWTSVSVAPGAPSSATFTLPANIETGASTLEVVANGIASSATPVSIVPPHHYHRRHHHV